MPTAHPNPVVDRPRIFWVPLTIISSILVLPLAALMVLPVSQQLSLPGKEAVSKLNQPPLLFDENGTWYSLTPAIGPVAKLQQRLERGELQITAKGHGYLLDLLDALDIPRASQILVFSKTSEQRDDISPGTPRAIYFNDSVYVAWIPDAPRIEIAATDPRLGAVFYTLEQESKGPRHLRRTDRCVECHTSMKNLGVPGFLVRSVATDENGVVDLKTGDSYVTHRTPIAKRWGGWYVCGTHGNQTHLGNLIGSADFERHAQEPNFGGNVAELSRFFPVDRYPERTSDIVALMVFEHQCHMQNLITYLHRETEKIVGQGGTIEGNTHLKEVAGALLKYLLFTEEAPLAAPVRGVSGFTRWFESRGPRDHQGRSLRQFDLQTRMFKYPCSYLIYSQSFEGLPRPMKLHLYRRLWKILNGEETDPTFRKMTAGTRQAIRDILAETKSDIPVYWTM